MKILLILVTLLVSHSVLSQVEFKWAIDETLHHQIRIAKDFSKEIEERTNGKVKVKIYLYGKKNGDFSPSGNSMVKIKSGVTDIHQSIVGNFIDEEPKLKVWDFPFLFKSNEHIENYIKSENAQRILRKLTNKEVVAVNYSFAGGFLHLFSRERVESFQQLKGFSCHFVPSYLFVQEFLAPLNLKNIQGPGILCGEVLSSEVDSLYAEYDMSKLWLNVTNHRVVSRITMVSRKKINRLSSHDRKIFMDLLSLKLDKERSLVYEAAKISLELLRNRGANIYVWNKAKVEEARSHFLPLYKKYASPVEGEVRFIEKLGLSSIAKRP